MNAGSKNYHSHYQRTTNQVISQYIALRRALGHEPTCDEIAELGGPIAKALDQEIEAGNKNPTTKELIFSLGTVIDADPTKLTK